MEKLLIHGQRPLCGQVSINGAKNAALAIIAASLLADDIVTLENIPDIDDIKNLVMVLEKMNVRT
ncbi:MAG: UDP-N-acetylglucosamine 1-carboxyvinyltransferase, partial [Clostridia bacterium]